MGWRFERLCRFELHYTVARAPNGSVSSGHHLFQSFSRQAGGKRIGKGDVRKKRSRWAPGQLCNVVRTGKAAQTSNPWRIQYVVTGTCERRIEVVIDAITAAEHSPVVVKRTPGETDPGSKVVFVSDHVVLGQAQGLGSSES